MDWRVLIVDGSGNAQGTVGNPINVSVSGGGSGGTSAVDESAWTAGVNSFNPGGGVFNDSAAALTSGQQGTLRVTPNRAQHVNLRNQAGAEITSFGGASATDEAAWTAGASTFGPVGAAFNDSATALTSGQQGTFRSTPNRALHVNIRNQAGTEVTAFGLSVVDEAAWTAGASSFTPGGGVFNDGAAALTSGQQGTFRTTPNRAIHSNPRSQNGTELYPVPAALADATANPTLTETQVFPSVFNGTTWDRLRDSVGATNGTVGTMAAGMMVFDTVDAQNKRVNSAASAVAGGVNGKNVALLGPVNYTVAHGSAPTAMAAGVFAAPLANRHSIPFWIGGHPNVVTFAQNYTTSQTDAAIVTVSAGTKIVVTSFMITCSNANTVNVSVRLGFGTANVPAYGNAGILGSHPNIAAGSGFGRGGGSGIIGVGADDEDLRITLSVPTGGSADINVSYFTVPS